MHTISLYVRSIVLSALLLLTLPALASQNTVLVVGDSLSAAHGVPSETAWVELLRDRIDSQELNWTVVNASIGGETTDGGLRRLPGLLETHDPTIVIIELGGNDGLRGFPPNVIESNLANMIEQVREIGATPLLVGMQIPPNYGQRYTTMFADIFPTLSDRYNTPLVPFFLDGIYDQDGLMQGDGIHPTEEAQPRLLDNIWPKLEPLLNKQASS
ncbi:arylesterase [Marinobacter nauticus]|jgi:acyl-CoA thioesterase-1|uniref:Acyl-CoA thioesterase-1 n=1 Tax=Marinobacter nauticus TaxID=2743 RepID=A0A368V0R7_MARNT|nr:arylesterase [Marinobacter nauticus]MBW3199461.1 arylesterase [Marinobacter nauticus]MBY6184877.1 arylesterase [Marinobacter nauticus]RBP73926.1 acyl-CoA thioesterase-1 [Marinobacter nauticus]RCW34676.1 acyl-CoA thioesterase-1 [Marinobacter nauticus]RKR78641.1 acyl-CoA thioesterase-1 [Marinobacter nauticus]